jgi:hypothetical protein
VRSKFATKLDPGIVDRIRTLAKRKDAQICEVAELAFSRYLQEDTAARTDATMAPLIDRMIETRHKGLEGGLRSMIARLAFETLTLQYILCNFLVEANIPASKVERWRTDGRKFAVQEFRRKPRELDEDEDDR